MGGFNIFWGNRLETLAETLGGLLRTPLSDPLQSEIIVVQNKGMQRWLSMRIAEKNGVCANIRFPFPRSLLYEITAGLTGLSVGDAYNPDLLAWRIMEVLPSCRDRSLYFEILNYLAGDYDGTKAFQLSSMLALTYDRYLAYRPEMISAWEMGDRGEGENQWQADLWRKIRLRSDACHPAGLRTALADKLNAPHGNLCVPQRISVFGISTLPPLYLDMFRLLSGIMEVNGFFLNPSREFWTDIRSEREIEMTVRRVREKTAWKLATSDDLYLHQGNRILASFGRSGRDFYSQLLQFPAEIRELFSDGEENTLLAIVQADILNLRDRGDTDTPVVVVPAQDRSVQLHCCHSPLREIEVLHDQLLDMFARDSALMPKDIVVMAPRIEEYGGIVEAIFGGGEIPFSIADRGFLQGNSVTRALLAALELLQSRFTVSAVMAMLDFEAVRNRFELTAEEVTLLRRWVGEAGIRWGIDAEDRKKADLPAFNENTWQMGMDRMLMGYAMGNDSGGQNPHPALFAGIAPYGDIEGRDGEILGRLIVFLDVLFSLQKLIAEPCSLTGWAACFLEMSAALLESSAKGSSTSTNTEEDLRRLRELIEEIGGIEEKAGFHGRVEFSTAISLLRKRLQDTVIPHGYLNGGVTFCSMVPMRSIPFSTVCLLGMNNNAYPRHTPPPGFDLMAQNPRVGDPSPRDDDRYLFLEALLSARKTFYISFTGISSDDNSAIPPSVVVSELLDSLAEGFLAEKGTLKEQLTTTHHLQAFHPAYFAREGKTDIVVGNEDINDSKLFSYSADNLVAARTLQGGHPAKKEFFAEPLPALEEGAGEVDIEDLQSFFSNPARYLLKKRIGINLENTTDIQPEKELFRIDGLSRYAIGENLVEHVVNGQDSDDIYHLLSASGKLPHGVVGVCEYESFSAEAGKLAAGLKGIVNDKKFGSFDVDLALAGIRLTGSIKYLWGFGILKHRFGAVRPKDFLRIWIELLLLSAGGIEIERPAHFFGRKEAWMLSPPENSLEILEELLKLYSGGITLPLPFFPVTSMCYAEARKNGKSEEGALSLAMDKWAGNENETGEGADPYFRRCFGEEPSLDDKFRVAAEKVFLPLLAGKTKYPL